MVNLIVSEREQDLEEYIDIFMNHLPEMLEHHEGKWTVIGKDEIPLDFWDDYQTAAREGVRQYGLSPFLVREVSQDYQTYGKGGKPLFL